MGGSVSVIDGLNKVKSYLDTVLLSGDGSTSDLVGYIDFAISYISDYSIDSLVDNVRSLSEDMAFVKSVLGLDKRGGCFEEVASNYDPFLEVCLTDLRDELPTMAINSLCRSGVSRVADLTLLCKKDLRRIRNVGKGSELSICNFMGYHDLHFSDNSILGVSLFHENDIVELVYSKDDLAAGTKLVLSGNGMSYSYWSSRLVSYSCKLLAPSNQRESLHTIWCSASEIRLVNN